MIFLSVSESVRLRGPSEKQGYTSRSHRREMPRHIPILLAFNYSFVMLRIFTSPICLAQSLKSGVICCKNIFISVTINLLLIMNLWEFSFLLLSQDHDSFGGQNIQGSSRSTLTYTICLSHAGWVGGGNTLWNFRQ